jgi:hypothetical protein
LETLAHKFFSYYNDHNVNNNDYNHYIHHDNSAGNLCGALATTTPIIGHHSSTRASKDDSVSSFQVTCSDITVHVTDSCRPSIAVVVQFHFVARYNRVLERIGIPGTRRFNADMMINGEDLQHERSLFHFLC